MLCLAKSQEVISLKFRSYMTKRNVIHIGRLSLDVTNDEVDICFLPNVL